MSTTKKSTVAGNAKRISELEQEVADLKSQLQSRPAPAVQASPADNGEALHNMTQLLRDMVLLRKRQIVGSQFDKRWNAFLGIN